MIKFENLKEKIWNSDFNRTNYEICLDFSYLKIDLIYWSLNTDNKVYGLAKTLSETYSTDDILNKITPEFQRDNDKWTKRNADKIR